MSAIDESLRNITYQDRDGYPYIIHPLMDGVPRMEADLLRDWTSWALDQPLLSEASLLLAPEAMGIHLAVPITMATETPYVVARKRQYHMDGERIAYCETGYGQSCIYLNDIGPGDRVLIVDDVVSTGGTLTSLMQAVRDTGAELLGAIVAIGKGDGAQKVSTNAGVPVRIMRHIAIEDGEFIISEQHD